MGEGSPPTTPSTIIRIPQASPTNTMSPISPVISPSTSPISPNQYSQSPKGPYSPGVIN